MLSFILVTSSVWNIVFSSHHKVVSTKTMFSEYYTSQNVITNFESYTKQYIGTLRTYLLIDIFSNAYYIHENLSPQH